MDRDAFAPQDIRYVAGFRPPPGFLKTLPNLKAVFSLGAGVDGFLRDPEFPRHLPLVRFVDPQNPGSTAACDAFTERVMAEILASGEAFFTGTTWRGKRAMRVIVCNWQTTAKEVDRVVARVDSILHRLNA